MADRNAAIEPIGRLGGVRWRRSGSKAAVTAVGAALMWALVEESSEHTLIYATELVLHNHQGPYATLPRESVSSFRIVEYGDSAPRIVAVAIDGREVKVAGSDQPQGPWMRDVIRPGRNAKEIKAKLDHWLTAGLYPN